MFFISTTVSLPLPFDHKTSVEKTVNGMDSELNIVNIGEYFCCIFHVKYILST